MSNISILIKPSSGLCNLDCKYCFYHDEMKNRDVKSFGFMSLDTFKNILTKFFNLPSLSSLTIAFQGGEPLLRGLEFYKSAIALVNEYNTKKINISYSVQTNGILIDEDYAKFFKENNFLVGISLDGTKNCHDKFRYDLNKKTTFDIILDKINLLKKFNVEFNILTVITKDISIHIEEIYKFYKENNFMYQQYIPCLNKLNSNNLYDYSLLPHDYELFLNRLFDLYYKDIKKGNYVYNRFFENILNILSKVEPESCDLQGNCSIQYVIESNGNVYPCDFYCLDEYIIGNINTNSIEEINKNKLCKEFIDESLKFQEKCRSCKYLKLCRNGCKRYRKDYKNIYCSSLYHFYDKNMDRLIELSKIIKEK